MQDGSLQTLRGAALLAFDVLQECHMQPPEALHSVSGVLHDNCILVSISGNGDLQAKCLRDHTCRDWFTLACRLLGTAQRFKMLSPSYAAAGGTCRCQAGRPWSRRHYHTSWWVLVLNCDVDPNSDAMTGHAHIPEGSQSAHTLHDRGSQPIGRIRC